MRMRRWSEQTEPTVRANGRLRNRCRESVPLIALGPRRAARLSLAVLILSSVLTTVCGMSSRFVQVTVVPAATVRVAGEKLKLSTFTSALDGAPC